MYRILNFIDLFSLPGVNSSVGWFVRSQWLQFKYTFWTSTAALICEPLLMSLILGFGIGSYVTDVRGLPYMEFLFPGIAALSVMMVSFTEVAYEMYRRLHLENYYNVILQAPLTTDDIAMGEIFWAALKGTVAGISVLILGASIGAVTSVLATAAPLLFLIAGFFFGGLGALVASIAKSSRAITLIQGFVFVPMALSCETIFPLSVLGSKWEMIGAWIPLTHLAEATRGMTTGHLSSRMLLNLAILIPLTMITLNLGKVRFSKRVIPG